MNYLIATDSKTLLDLYFKDKINGKEQVIRMQYPLSSITDILEEANYYSLFEEKKIIIVKNATFFGTEKGTEKDIEKLIAYLNAPNLSTSIYFTLYEMADKRKMITKRFIDEKHYVELISPRNYELINEVNRILRKYHPEDRVAKYIVDACLGNYDLVYNELLKLDLYFKKDDIITMNDIVHIIPSNATDNLFKFVDAVINKKRQEVLHLYEDFQTLKIDPLQLFNLFIREYHLLVYYKLLEKKNTSYKEIMGELKLQEWQLNKLQKEATMFHFDDLKDYLILLENIDYKIKSGLYDKNMALIVFIIMVLD